MIEIGTSTHAVAGFGPPSKSFDQAVAEAAECGYKHLLLLASEKGPAVDETGTAPEALVDVSRSDLPAILRTVSRHGLRVGCLYPGFGPDFSPEQAEATIDRLTAYRDMAWRLGCHMMVHSAGQAKSPRLPHEQKRESIRHAAQVMDAVASDAPGAVFKMAVDVHYGGIVETVADCEYLLECAGTQNAGLCLNTGHMTTLGQAGWTLLSRFPERIHVIAWKDHLVGDDLPKPVVSCELGKGRSPFPRYVEAYRSSRCGALHLVTFEDVPFPEKRGALERSRQYLSTLLEAPWTRPDLAPARGPARYASRAAPWGRGHRK